MQQSKDVFDVGWAGQSAEAAKSMVDKLDLQIDSHISSAQDVSKAVRTYIDEIASIKRLARDPRSRLTAAFDAIQEELITSPSGRQYTPAMEARDIDLEDLAELATRRQAADEAVLGSVRSTLALTWEIEPSQFPSDRDWLNQGTYEYSMDQPLGFTNKQYTAKELMDFFKAHPGEVFPFPVSGKSDVFEDGAVFTLEDTLFDFVPLSFETGKVVVSTTDTSVKFTVISDSYFDGPGSTIEFSIVEVNGEYVLRQVADATDVLGPVSLGAEAGAKDTWAEQAENLKNVVNKYGEQDTPQTDSVPHGVECLHSFWIVLLVPLGSFLSGRPE